MEAVGAVGSVLQIAQDGAQLSLNLFKISHSVGSKRDVQHFAKDIALFSTILKDLGNTLAKGETSKLYRENAYQEGSGIAKDCKEVFEEIQDSLNKFNKNGGATPPSTKRVDKQIFRKSQPQLLRGKLEFLRSKILLQVAVLSYAEKASASPKSTADIGGLLVLKSLVLANETTETAFHDLYEELSIKSSEGSSLGNPISIPDNPRFRTSNSSASAHQSSPTAPPTFLSIAQILHESDPPFPSSRATSTSDLAEQSPVQKREATRQAVDNVNMSSMAIERPYGPQDLHHAQPVARSESRQTHLTVPANVAMPRRASGAMNPPPKSSSISSGLERRSFDTNPQIKVEMDRPRSIREASTSMATTGPPSVNIISEEGHAGRSGDYRPTEPSQRSLGDANSRRYAGAHLSVGRDIFSASPRIHGPKKNRQHDSPTGPGPFLFPPSTLKRKSLKEESPTPTATSRQSDHAPHTTSMPEPWQWFESEKHDKTSQTVRDLLKRWTFLDLGDEDPDAQRRRGRDEDEEAGSRAEAQGTEGEISRHRRGDGGGGGSGDGGGSSGEEDERAGDGGAERRKRMRRF